MRVHAVLVRLSPAASVAAGALLLEAIALLIAVFAVPSGCDSGGGSAEVAEEVLFVAGVVAALGASVFAVLARVGGRRRPWRHVLVLALAAIALAFVVVVYAAAASLCFMGAGLVSA